MRYYQIIFERDLFGDWVLTKVWGGINTANGRICKIACASYEDGLKKVTAIEKTRAQRGYVLVR